MNMARPRHRRGEFASVSAGNGPHLRVEDGRLRRLLGGDDKYGQATPPEGEFASVSAGMFASVSAPPEGEFASVSAGRGHTCGVEGGRLRRLLGRRSPDWS